MPIYCYKCKNCKSEFEVRHGMSESHQRCVDCDSDDIFRIPSLQTRPMLNTTNKPGSVVKQFIEDTKRAVKNEKEAMKRGDH